MESLRCHLWLVVGQFFRQVSLKPAEAQLNSVYNALPKAQIKNLGFKPVDTMFTILEKKHYEENPLKCLEGLKKK